MDDRDYNATGSRSQRSYPTQSRMTRETPPGRIYVGNLPPNADRKFVEDVFSKHGRIVDISVKKTVSGTPFAFVEYDDPQDALDAIREKDRMEVEGSQLRVEVPFQNRAGGGGGMGGGGMHSQRGGGGYSKYPRSGGGGGGGRRGEFRLLVHGLPTSGSWQDLKDHMRDAGECLFADVYRDGTGVVEFARLDDLEYALRSFQDSKFRSHEGETSYIKLTRGNESPRYHHRSSPVYNGSPSISHRDESSRRRSGGGGSSRYGMSSSSHHNGYNDCSPSPNPYSGGSSRSSGYYDKYQYNSSSSSTSKGLPHNPSSSRYNSSSSTGGSYNEDSSSRRYPQNSSSSSSGHHSSSTHHNSQQPQSSSYSTKSRRSPSYSRRSRSRSYEGGGSSRY